MSGEDFQTIWIPNKQVRGRAEVPSTTRAALEAVKGFLKPRYIEYMEDGRRVAELRQADLDRVQDGYACGECLAFFEQRFINCPSCGHLLDPSRDIVEHRPDYWLPYEGRTSDEILGRSS